MPGWASTASYGAMASPQGILQVYYINANTCGRLERALGLSPESRAHLKIKGEVGGRLDPARAMSAMGEAEADVEEGGDDAE